METKLIIQELKNKDLSTLEALNLSYRNDEILNTILPLGLNLKKISIGNRGISKTEVVIPFDLYNFLCKLIENNINDKLETLKFDNLCIVFENKKIEDIKNLLSKFNLKKLDFAEVYDPTGKSLNLTELTKKNSSDLNSI